MGRFRSGFGGCGRGGRDRSAYPPVGAAAGGECPPVASAGPAWSGHRSGRRSSSPRSRPGLVTMASPVQDKLALYADRFRARTDVYAVRWENQRTGDSGWMPAVAGGWRKGWTAAAASHLPLTADVIGSASGRRRVHRPVPAADRTTPATSWSRTSTARRRCSTRWPTSRRPEPAACRRRWRSPSRVAARTCGCSSPTRSRRAIARAVGTALIHEAMVLRGSMDLRSYDRLFPNQDVLPEGGFGNLIAAPLQGRRRKARADGLPRPRHAGAVRGPVGVPLHAGPAQPGRRATGRPAGEARRRRQRRRRDEPVGGDPGPPAAARRSSTRSSAPG